jgi:hypothetical protein
MCGPAFCAMKITKDIRDCVQRDPMCKQAKDLPLPTVAGGRHQPEVRK